MNKNKYTLPRQIHDIATFKNTNFKLNVPDKHALNLLTYLETIQLW